MIALEKCFSSSRNWHRDERVIPLVEQYQATLDAALTDRPDLEGCVTCCCECQIRFLTDPRNAGRQDLRCPFGCRKQHQKECGNHRSRKYYGTPRGQKRKKTRNGRRSDPFQAASRGDQPPNDPARVMADVQVEVAGDLETPSSETPSCSSLFEPPFQVELSFEGVTLDEADVEQSAALAHVRMLLRVIDGVRVSEKELVAMLRPSLRQRSMARRNRRDYVLNFLNSHPP